MTANLLVSCSSMPGADPLNDYCTSNGWERARRSRAPVEPDRVQRRLGDADDVPRSPRDDYVAAENLPQLGHAALI
jgi:hypothetical protein